MLYPPLFNLRAVERDGTGDRQLTFGDVSYVEPDVHMSGIVTGSRIRMQSDIWKFPVNGPPAENTRRGFRITHQTGQAQTPSVSPDESEVVYLSDSGGHGNLWIARTDGSGVRQITFERNPAISVGVPVWSPTGNQIVFILTRAGMTGLSLINRDGSGLRQFVAVGYSASLVRRRPMGVLLAGHRRHDLHREDGDRRRAGDFHTVRQRQRFSSDG